MVLLLPVVGGAPLPVMYRISTMTNRMPGHGARLALVDLIVDLRPIDVARLGLDQPEIATFEATCKIMCCAAHKMIVVSGSHVPIPRGEIEISAQFVVVKGREPAHKVMGRPNACGD